MANRAPSLLGFVWRHSRWQQCGLLALTLISFPIVYLSLEVPKVIVNDAIAGEGFPKDVIGWPLGRIEYLLLLSGLFFLLVVLHNALKWLINVGLGMAGERMLRRLRSDLTEQVSRFPMRRLRSARPGETIQSIMGEVEPLGGFFGEVLVTPVFQGGLLAVYIGFIFVQDVWLGLAAIAFYPVQTVLVPILQARIVALNRARASNARVIADRIGDIIQLSSEIRSHGTARWHLAGIGRLLGRNTEIRQAIFRRKYTIKLINNLLNQLTPFLFFSIGGYLVIVGSLDFGALVAVLAAYKDLAGPWKALLGYAQRLSDFSGRYSFVLEAFRDAELVTPAPAGAGLQTPSGPLVMADVPPDPTMDRPEITELVINQGETVVLTGGSAPAREGVLQLAAGIEPPEAGSVRLGETDLARLGSERIGAVLGLVPPVPGLIPGTLRDNLAYGLLRARDPDQGEPSDGWVDHAAAGVADANGLDARLSALSTRFGLASHLRSVGLGRRISAEEAAEWGDRLLRLRAKLGAAPETLSDLVERWHPERYNQNGTLLANLLFALPVDPDGMEKVLDQPDVRRVLRKTGAQDFLLDTGWRIATALAEIAETMAETSHLLDRLTGFSRQDGVDAVAIVGAADGTGPKRLGRAEKARLVAMAAGFVQALDQLSILDETSQARLLEIRTRARPLIQGHKAFAAIDQTRYNPALSVADNLLHGARRFDRRSQWGRLDDLLDTAMAEAGLSGGLLRIGMEASVAEASMPTKMLRRLGLIRVLVKRPKLLLIAGGADLHADGEAALLDAVRESLPEVAILLASDTIDAIWGPKARMFRIDERGLREVPAP
ncbi:MAG: ABC transporter ATP-binding protein [Pseudomonadota bacterium]